MALLWLVCGQAETPSGLTGAGPTGDALSPGSCHLRARVLESILASILESTSSMSLRPQVCRSSVSDYQVLITGPPDGAHLGIPSGRDQILSGRDRPLSPRPNPAPGPFLRRVPSCLHGNCRGAPLAFLSGGCSPIRDGEKSRQDVP